jgi:hypothetical protein
VGGDREIVRTGFNSVAEHDGHRDGWSECFARLEEQLAQGVSA